MISVPEQQYCTCLDTPFVQLQLGRMEVVLQTKRNIIVPILSKFCPSGDNFVSVLISLIIVHKFASRVLLRFYILF